MLFRFYCDESHNGIPDSPTTLTISGFFSDLKSWEEVELQWTAINNEYGVSRFHAVDLNGQHGEYEGWPKPKRDEYSSRLLDVLGNQGKRIVAFNCGMRADAYRREINAEGQNKLGPPWFACFKSCIAMIAKHMETLPAEDRFSVVVEQGSGFNTKAVSFFDKLAADSHFPYRNRLERCTSATPQQFAGLQAADMMAYEYFRRLHSSNASMRVPLERIRASTNYAEGFFGASTFKEYKLDIESATCGQGEFVFIPNLIDKQLPCVLGSL